MATGSLSGLSCRGKSTHLRLFEKTRDMIGKVRRHQYLLSQMVPAMRACPLARLLRACGQLRYQIKLPACPSLGVAGRDTGISWHALLVHLRHKASAPEASRELAEDMATVAQAWAAMIRRRFRRRGGALPAAAPSSWGTRSG